MAVELDKLQEFLRVADRISFEVASAADFPGTGVPGTAPCQGGPVHGEAR